MGLIYKKLRVIGRKGERKVEALFDSGSTHSLIRSSIAHEIGEPEGLPEPKTDQAVVGRVIL